MVNHGASWLLKNYHHDILQALLDENQAPKGVFFTIRTEYGDIEASVLRFWKPNWEWVYIPSTDFERLISGLVRSCMIQEHNMPDEIEPNEEATEMLRTLHHQSLGTGERVRDRRLPPTHMWAVALRSVIFQNLIQQAQHTDWAKDSPLLSQ